MTGRLATIDLDTFAVSTNVAEISSDPVARTADGLLYIVNRFGADNIQILDPAAGFETTAQYSTGTT